MCETWRVTGRPEKSLSRTPSGVRMAMSPSARKNMSWVWVRMAGTSEATKYSLSPMPITTGGPERAATILLGSGARDHGQGKHSCELVHSGAHGLFQVALEVRLHQVGDDFGVGLGLELVAFGFQALFQRQVVFDDPVVHHHHVAMAVAVRMSVFLGGPPMRGPAGVPDAESALHRIEADGLFQVAQFALGAADFQIAVAVHRQPRRIVSTVLQALQAFEDNRNRLMLSDIAHNSAHRSIISACLGL